jgi:hypothetical protein
MMKGEARPTIPALPVDPDEAPISVDEDGIPAEPVGAPLGLE